MMNMRLLFDNFDLLFNSPERIQELRKFILQLAVQGKLVPQDPNDEPASELLKKIKAEKEKLIKEGKIRKEKPLPPIKPEEIPYELPRGWEWVRLIDVTTKITDGEHLNPKYADNGVPILSAKHIGESNLIFNDYKYVLKKDAENFLSKCNPENGDILVVSRGGGVGRTIISKSDVPYCLMGSVLLFKPSKHINNRYLYYFLNSSKGTERLKTTSSATAQPAIYIVHLKRNYVLSLPPLEEQERIIVKVDQLMKLCDDLESRLQQSRKDSEHLMQAVLQEAVGQC